MSAFQTEGKVYLILDFLRGGDLFTRLSKEVRCMLFCSVKKQSECAIFLLKFITSNGENQTLSRLKVNFLELS